MPLNRRCIRASLFLLATQGFACGSGANTTMSASTSGGSSVTSTSGASTTGAGGAGGGFHVAPHAPFPQLPDQGGPTLDKVHIVSVSYAGTKYATELGAFGDWLVTSTWFTGRGAEYGVGAGTHEQRLLSAAPPTTLSTSDAVSFITSRVMSGDLPAPTPETLYMLYVPPETALTDIEGGCDGGNAYPSAFHMSGTMGATTFQYAMVPICAQSSIDWIEGGAGHEIIETATDPLPLTKPAYQFAPGDPWISITGEVADLCEALPNATVDAFSVPLVWSNAAAKKGDGWPCLPAPTTPYFGVSAPDPEVTVAAGASTAVTLSPWSSAPVDAWSVETYVQDVYPPSVSFVPKATLSTSVVQNGDPLTLSIDAPAGAAHGAEALVVLISTAGKLRTFWPIVVKVP